MRSSSSEAADLVISGGSVVLADGVRPAAVSVRGGHIAGVHEPGEAPPAAEVVDAGDDVVMAGVVDTHVHVNEPGRSEWEGFATATRAAAAGGVTTLVDMPLNSSPVTTTAAALEAKAAAAASQALVDYGFWGGAIPGNLEHLAPLAEAGVLGFKCFLVDSGLDEFPPLPAEELPPVAAEVARLGLVLLAHAEAPGPIAAAAAAWESAEASSYAAYLRSRPPAAEEEAIGWLLEAAAASGCRVHVVHLATETALAALALARAAGVAVSVETCPHYLFFRAEDLLLTGATRMSGAPGATRGSKGGAETGATRVFEAGGVTVFKCAPPIRGERTREGLWRGLAEGVIDLVASDHSPCPPAMKCLETGDLRSAWGGIASLQLGLPALWTAARGRGFGLGELSRWLSAAPARLAGLERSKGALVPGLDADLVIWSPEEEWEVRAEALHHRHPLTPYLGRRLAGVVRSTWLRGRRIYLREPGGEGRFAPAPAGRWLRRRRC